MRPCDGKQLGLVLALVRFPQERVAFDDAPFARGLLAGDVEVQMRPAARAAFLAEDADELPHLDLRPWLDRFGDRVEMAVAIEPAALVEQIHNVIARLRGRVLEALEQFLSR